MYRLVVSQIRLFDESIQGATNAPLMMLTRQIVNNPHT